MHDIFISYSSKDREWVARLANALEVQGYRVWWDPEILPGQHYQDVIQKALHGAKSVVAVWTADAVRSDYVRAECLWAFTKRNLISVLGKDAEIPTPFNAIQAADLRKWKGSADDPQFQRLLRGIHFAQTGETQVQRPPNVDPPPPKFRMGMVLVGAAAVAVVGGSVYWQQNGGSGGGDAPVGVGQTVMSVEPKPKAPLPAVTKSEVPKNYRLTVKTMPENAVITVDGNAYETGNVWKAGTYTVKAVAEGFKPAEQVVTIKDQDAQINLTLEAIRYMLTINTKPETAKISLSGGLSYSSGMLLPPGDYVAKVEAEGHQPQEKAFAIAASDQTLDIALKPDRLAYEPEMVDIPAGTFTMGCDPKRDDVEGGCSGNEKPAHKVTLSAFNIGKYEVTFDEWDACEKAKACPHAEDQGWGRGNRPVIKVSWNDITQKYIPWLKKETGKAYRLPTEAEWEYAARGGQGGAYPWGQEASHEYANYGKDACCGGLVSGKDQWEYIAPVGSFAANGYGLHDMHGNVWEWCQDWYDSGYYASSPASNPEGAANGAYRVLRGGSWNSDAQDVRSANRLRDTPDNQYDGTGFRLVLP